MGMTLNTLSLRSPEYGNTDSTLVARVARIVGTEARYVNKTVPVERQFHFTVTVINAADKDDIVSLFLANLGKELTLTDHNGDVYTGIINNDFTVAEEKSGWILGFTWTLS